MSGFRMHCGHLINLTISAALYAIVGPVLRGKETKSTFPA